MLNERLEQILRPAVEALGYELVLLEFVPGVRHALLRIYIDWPGQNAEQGITLDDCERVSRELAALLDVEDPIAQPYQLEISSPGVDRPLVRPEHYVRFAGEEVRIQLHAARGGRRRFQGVLLGVNDGSVHVETADGVVHLPLLEIEKARLLPKLEFRGSDHE